MKYIAYHPDNFKHVFLPYLLAFFQVVILIAIELVSCWVLTMMPNVFDVLLNFIAFEVIF